MPGHFENGVWMEENNTAADTAFHALHAGNATVLGWIITYGTDDYEDVQ